MINIYYLIRLPTENRLKHNNSLLPTEMLCDAHVGECDLHIIEKGEEAPSFLIEYLTNATFF